MKQRILGYDVAKGIAMLLVVLLHYAIYTRHYAGDIIGNVVTSLCVVCVPLFFTVNGALLLPRTLDYRKHYRKLATIVVVVAVWKTIAAVFFMMFDGSHTVGIKDFLKFQLGGNFGEYPTGYFWFMNALIAVYLVYPLVKLMIDDHGIALWSCMAVLFGLTVCKDTVAVVLDVIGTVSHHELTSLLGSLGEYDIFGNYGYVMLYFMIGGLIGRQVAAIRDGSASKAPSIATCWIVVVIGFACTVAVQRFQHMVAGVNLTVNYGYWLLPTVAMTCAILLICVRVTVDSGLLRGAITAVGGNTFGIYMLHMFAIVAFSRLQASPVLAWMSTLPTGVNTVVNVGFAIVLFICCTLLAVGLKRIPGVRILLSA